ncbi:CHASE2 domain-containing protein [Desertibaculum subflavum]|uniref:CHASE2 domain-containing protein n=1 Tax=Desertibaculum subflavum TaxID=2268458 RepID=UPI000E66B19B
MMRGLKRHFATTILPALVLVLALTWRQSDPGDLIERVRQGVFDQYQRLAPRVYQDVPVRIVDIDDETLARTGQQWPWPRTVVAELVANLANAGAAVIAFDIVFAEPDRTSPAGMLKLWSGLADGKQLAPALAQVPDHDAVLADVIAQSGNVVTGFVLKTDPGGTPPGTRASVAFGGDDPRLFLHCFEGSVVNLAPLEKAAAGNGTFSFSPGTELVVRRIPLLLAYNPERHGCTSGPLEKSQFQPALSTEALRVAQGAKTYRIKSSGSSGELAFGERTGVVSVNIGQTFVPTDRFGQIILHFTPPVARRYVPAWKVLQPDYDGKEVEGAIVLIGTSASGLRDLRPSPLNPAMPGVEAHANALEQMLLEHYLDRPDWADGVEWLFVLVLGIVTIALLGTAGALASAVVGATAIIGTFAISWFAYIEWRWLFDPVTPGFAAFAVYLSGSLTGYLRTEAEKRQVRAAFGQYLSPAVVEQIAEHPELLRLGGQTRDMTILFSDIRGFTTISERFKSNPQGLTHLINRFLTPMTNIIEAQGGTIDKYIGDCIMAFWNAPLDDPAHAANACDTALAMLARLAALNDELEAEARAEGRIHAPLNVGIGLNTGDVVVGNMGSEKRLSYTVMGDAVNLASRLEGQSKTYGVAIVIGERTRALAPDHAHLELDRIAVKGKQEAVTIYTVLGGPEMRASDAFRALAEEHGHAIAAYRAQDWPTARRAISRARAMEPRLLELYDLYEERIMHFEANPPAAGWDGVFVATEK